jgi:hypothetical protein
MCALRVASRVETKDFVIFARLAITAHLQIPPPCSNRSLPLSTMRLQVARPTASLAQRVSRVLTIVLNLARSQDTA